MTRFLGLRIPNVLFVLIAALAATYAAIWIFAWRSANAQTFPKSVSAVVEFFGSTKITVQAKRDPSQHASDSIDDSGTPVQPRALGVVCPVDSARIDLWPIVSEMIADHQKKRKGRVVCPRESGHSAEYEITIDY